MYSDLHCHPFLRPFSRTELADPGIMSANPCDETSVWHKTHEGGDIIELQHEIGFIGFTETDFKNVSVNDGTLLVASLFAVEAGFFELRKGFFTAILKTIGVKNILEVFVGQLISKFGKSQIQDTQDNAFDYFDILMKQTKFVLQASGVPDISGCADPDYKGLTGKQFQVIKPGDPTSPVVNTVKVLWSIEGANSLWNSVVDGRGNTWNCRNFDRKGIRSDIDKYTALPGADYASKITPAMIDERTQLSELIPWEVCDSVKANLVTLKDLASRPFFITVAHHFYNGIVGHASSLHPLTGATKVLGVSLHLLDQSFGCNTDITNLGWMVINEMLRDKSKRILVDVKHMSVRGRMSFYKFRKRNYPDVPIVFSHGAVYGGHLKNPDIFTKRDDIANNVSDPHAQFFYKEDINLLDDDIREIVQSGGLMGVEFDKRVNGVKGSRSKNDQKAEMYWHNIRYIAEVAAIYKKPEQSAWDFISIGSDYDGIINPMDNYGTAETIPDLRKFVGGLLTQYLGSNTALKNDKITDVNQILDKLFFRNIADFAGQYYQ